VSEFLVSALAGISVVVFSKFIDRGRFDISLSEFGRDVSTGHPVIETKLFFKNNTSVPVTILCLSAISPFGMLISDHLVYSGTDVYSNRIKLPQKNSYDLGQPTISPGEKTNIYTACYSPAFNNQRVSKIVLQLSFDQRKGVKKRLVKCKLRNGAQNA